MTVDVKCSKMTAISAKAMTDPTHGRSQLISTRLAGRCAQPRVTTVRLSDYQIHMGKDRSTAISYNLNIFCISYHQVNVNLLLWHIPHYFTNKNKAFNNQHTPFTITIPPTKRSKSLPSRKKTSLLRTAELH